MNGAVAGVYRAELRKLLSQLSTRVLLLACALGPFAFAAVLSLQSGVPADTLLGVWVHSSGFAVSFVVLGFGGYLGFAVIAGVLAGDLFSSEDRYGTWKTVLTRSRTRREVFAGKLLAAGVLALALLALLAASSLLAGLICTGDQPLVGLGGHTIGARECLWLVLASWLVSVPVVLAFVGLAVLFSIAGRNGIVGVVGPVLVALVMQLLALIGSGSIVHFLLLASAFDAWHGLLASPAFYRPLAIGVGVSVVWLLACLWGSWVLLRRRDFAGPPVSRKAGWLSPARVVLAATALILVLGAAGNLGPAAITQGRVEAAIAPAFSELTRLQQSELGRHVPSGASLPLRSRCGRRSGKSEGPGDDWSCTLTVIAPQGNASPFQLTPVTYDVEVRSNGCYKAQAPPSFVGQQMMRDSHHREVVNPLFTIYGCFDITAAAPRCPEIGGCANSPRHVTRSTPGSTRLGTGSATRQRELQALHEAEQAAGPRVMREVAEAEQRARREAQQPAPEGPSSTTLGK